MLRAAGLYKLAPLFVGASVVGAFLEVLTLGLIAQAAVAITSHTDKLHLTGPLSVLNATSPTELIVIGLVLLALRIPMYIVIAEVPARVSARVQEVLRGRLFHAYLHAPWLEQMVVRDGHLLEMASTQTQQAAQAVVMAMLTVCWAVSLLVLVAGAIAFSPLAALAVLAALCILFFAARPLAGAVARSAEAHAASSQEFMVDLTEATTLVGDVRTYGVMSAEEERVRRSLTGIRGPWERVQRAHGLVPGAYQTAATAFMLAGLAVVSASGTAGSLGNLGAVVLILFRALSASQQLQYGYQRLGEAKPFIDRTIDAIDTFEVTRTEAGRHPLPHLDSLRLDDVSFRYRDERAALESIDLDVRRGEAVAVTGPSGAGKSTLAAILLRLLPPDRGTFTVNDIPVDDVVDADWARLIGYVPQEGRLLHGTVADNIRFLREGISDDDVRAAARAAHLEDDVLRWPAGYDTVISQRTEAVSGGQRQRICLARALVCHPDLLILDEPTSALDHEAEEVVFTSIAALKGSVTMIVISHRTRLLDFCDRVVVLREGRIEDDGTVDGTPHPSLPAELAGP